MEATKELFHERVKAGGRTYFLNVKETKDGKPYLSLVESRKQGDNFEKSRLLVFQDHLDDFIKGLQSVQAFVANYSVQSGTTPSQSTAPPPPPGATAATETMEEEDLPF